MRQGIHPDYYQATVTCNCGNTFVTGSTKESIHVEICSKCHPFYTGQQKATQARGRIDKFNKKYGNNLDGYPVSFNFTSHNNFLQFPTVICEIKISNTA